MIIMRQNNQLDAPSVLGYWHGGAGRHAVWGGRRWDPVCNPIPDKVARNGLNCRKKKCVSVVSALIPKPVRHRIDISRERQDDQRPVKKHGP